MRRIGLSLVLLLLPASAAAQVDEARIAQAREHFTRAEALYRADDFEGALSAFQEAYGLMDGHPNQGMVLYNTARCYDRLRRYPEAMADYQRFLVEAPDDAEHRDDARRRADDLRPVVESGQTTEPRPLSASGEGGEARSEGSIANWLIAAGLVLAAVPAIAIPSWTLATEGECVDIDSAGCLERVQFGATDGVFFGLAGLAIAGAVVFAIAQPIEVEVVADSQRVYVGVRGVF